MKINCEHFKDNPNYNITTMLQFNHYNDPVHTQ